ncbi:hypothetical protein MKW92_017169 [Papaver armeniacum]|nr:hypothetical protein MKW92_017169 [Papaver armeniacum]
MADKASRSLIIYGDGCVKQISSSHTHSSSSSQSEDERVVRELAQLLDAFDAYKMKKGGSCATSECSKESLVSTMSDRFMGLKAAIVSTNSNVKSFGRYLGFTVLEFDNLTKDKPSFDEPLACELLKLLGFHGGETLDTSEFDLVFVHLGCSEKVNVVKEEGVGNEVECINSLVGGILQIALPGSEIGSHLQIVILSIENSCRNHEKKCMVNFFLFQLFLSDGSFYHAERGNLAIPADRFLHEVAFKLWKAPKYGA